MIRLTFLPAGSDAPALARAPYFRICADGTLRGPDNTIAAAHSDRSWVFGQRRYRSFECEGPVYVRTRAADGSLVRLGPYEFLREAQGALYTRDTFLGIYLPCMAPVGRNERRQEVTLLST